MRTSASVGLAAIAGIPILAMQGCMVVPVPEDLTVPEELLAIEGG